MTLKHVAEVEIEGMDAKIVEDRVFFIPKGKPRQHWKLKVAASGDILAIEFTPTIPQRIALLQALAKEEDWRDELEEALIYYGCVKRIHLFDQPKYSIGAVDDKDGAFHPKSSPPFSKVDFRYYNSMQLQLIVDGFKRWEEEQHGA